MEWNTANTFPIIIWHFCLQSVHLFIHLKFCISNRKPETHGSAHHKNDLYPFVVAIVVVIVVGVGVGHLSIPSYHIVFWWDLFIYLLLCACVRASVRYLFSRMRFYCFKDCDTVRTCTLTLARTTIVYKTIFCCYRFGIFVALTHNQMGLLYDLYTYQNIFMYICES